MTEIKVGNAPCSWGTLEFGGLAGEEIEYSKMLDELAETGYTGTELGDWGYMPTSPDRLRAELARRKLTMLGAFVPVAFSNPAAHGPGEEHALKVARLLAAVDAGHRPFLVLADANGTDPVRTAHAGRITADTALSDDAWKVFADGVQRVANAVAGETGLPSVFHHHCAGFVETPDEISRLLDLTNPDTVGLVFDTGHYAFGADSCDEVPAGFERFRDRIRYVHFKDCDSDIANRSRVDGWDYFTSLRHGIFCELGSGCVDFPAVIDLLRDDGYDGWIVVEQDVLPGMGAPKLSAARNREYLKTLRV